jgi:putative endonuclease
MSFHYVYLAQTRAGAFYAGYALDPRRRVAQHNAGAGAKSLRGARPVRLAFVRRFHTKGDALRYEFALKRRTHGFKSALSRRWLTRKGTARWTIE